jgi:hypothetical protein
MIVANLVRETAEKEKDLRKQVKQIEEILERHITRL